MSKFIANYKRPPYTDVNSILFPPKQISGKVVGYRGNILFLDGNRAVNMKLLQGYVFQGEN